MRFVDRERDQPPAPLVTSVSAVEKISAMLIVIDLLVMDEPQPLCDSAIGVDLVRVVDRGLDLRSDSRPDSSGRLIAEDDQHIDQIAAIRLRRSNYVLAPA